MKSIRQLQGTLPLQKPLQENEEPVSSRALTRNNYRSGVPSAPRFMFSSPSANRNMGLSYFFVRTLVAPSKRQHGAIRRIGQVSTR